MDFGLAAVTGELRETQAREGTPAYMAPEQLAGSEVTARSDIYALGLVFYEMFTGKRPFEAPTMAEMIRLQQASAPVSLTTLAKDVDPAVERVIMRCLAPEPRRRPAAALSVAAALPGGDPLAAALAAGETPSPDLVAAAGPAADISKPMAVLCLAATMACVAAAMALAPHANPVSRVNLEFPPDVLSEKARDLARSLGYTLKPAAVARGFSYDQDYMQYVERTDKSAHRWDQRLGSARPPLIDFWYRQSPRALEPQAFAIPSVSLDDPAPIISGMVSVLLDPQGRLTEFDAVPPQVDPDQAGAPPPDWKRLFDAAGLDITRFAPAAPQWTPLGICDARAAWSGAFADPPTAPLRVEAAAWRGKLVYFQVIGPWTRPARMRSFHLEGGMKALAFVGLSIAGMLLIAAVALARRNLRRERGDRRGAARLSGFTGMVCMLIWALEGSHVPGIGELALFAGALGFALFLAGLMWILYMAVEPAARRRWPHSMIGWNRLLAGGFRDPLVGRDMLAGAALGSLMALLALAQQYTGMRFGASLTPSVSLDAVLGVPGILGTFLMAIPNSVVQALVGFIIMFVMRLIFRRDWLAAAGFVVLEVGLGMLAYTATAAPWITAMFVAARTILVVFVMLRYGLLALIVSSFVVVLLILFPITSDFSVWYSGATVFATLAIAAIVVLGFRNSLAGRPLLGDADL
jgi:serine/threonine-protein kinase